MCHFFLRANFPSSFSLIPVLVLLPALLRARSIAMNFLCRSLTDGLISSSGGLSWICNPFCLPYAASVSPLVHHFQKFLNGVRSVYPCYRMQVRVEKGFGDVIVVEYAHKSVHTSPSISDCYPTNRPTPRISGAHLK